PDQTDEQQGEAVCDGHRTFRQNGRTRIVPCPVPVEGDENGGISVDYCHFASPGPIPRDVDFPLNKGDPGDRVFFGMPFASSRPSQDQDRIGKFLDV
ncbi:MAG: hypothetical protein ACQET0_13070, partial [Pseudomonadota bacterium]